MHQDKTDHDLEIYISYMSLYTTDPTKQAYCMERLITLIFTMLSHTYRTLSVKFETKILCKMIN